MVPLPAESGGQNLAVAVFYVPRLSDTVWEGGLHQRLEVNYLPRFSPQLISLER